MCRIFSTKLALMNDSYGLPLQQTAYHMGCAQEIALIATSANKCQQALACASIFILCEPLNMFQMPSSTSPCSSPHMSFMYTMCIDASNNAHSYTHIWFVHGMKSQPLGFYSYKMPFP